MNHVQKSNKFRHVIFICIFSTVIYTSCSTLQNSTIKTSESNQTANEIDDIIKHDKLTDKQKIVLTHARLQLLSVNEIDSQNRQLQSEFVKESKLAGAGKMVYTVIYFVGFFIVVFIGFKILKRIGIF